MITGTDFIQPEFMNILFFQQKNLVIFPYVDLKHLHFLELFTIGYNVVDLESTALHNLKDILEFETTNDYSQNPTIFFISNVDKLKVKEVMELDDIHCIINSNEKRDLGELVNGTSFIFYNKKSNQFLNYNSNSDLEFEKWLISTSKNKEILQDKIQKIKMTSTKIYTELIQEEKPNLPAILKEYDKKFWQQIIDYTGSYYNIEVPEIQHNSIHNASTRAETNETKDDFSEEYEIIVSTHKPIGKEFILLIHEYRRKKVNPSHLELEELFNPKELYNYLRNRHWKSGIPKEFIRQWAQMKMSGYQLDEREKEGFENIVKLLPIDVRLNTQPIKPYQQILKKRRGRIPTRHKVVPQGNLSELIPSVKKEWSLFKKWLENKVDTLESLIDTLNSDKIIDDNLQVSDPSEINSKTIFIDSTNILNEDKDVNGELKVRNILKLSFELRAKGSTFVHIIDASTRHCIDDITQLDKLISEKEVILAPIGKKADEYVLECAKRFKGLILSNDAYKKYWKQYGQKWIYNRKFTCKFIQGKFIIV